jgi:hypothetical protein
MRLHITVLTAALALAAACNKGPDEAKPSSGASAPPAQASTPTTPADVGQPDAQERRDGANPVQGQVDPKEREQHRDFQQRGDAAGPKGPDTTPKPGS